jgi:hypothetical protein
MLRSVCLAIGLLLGPPGICAQRLMITNSLSVDRPPEVIEIPLQQVLDQLHIAPAQAPAIVAEVAGTGERIPAQVYTSHVPSPPDRLLLLVHLRAHAVSTIQFRLNPGAPRQTPLVFGRDAPERKDDFAWENEQVAYRIYGPALEATGEIASGIDVWSKRVPNFVIDSFYKRDAEGARTHNSLLSYHKDNGQGLDSYFVGPTRGCGGTAVLAGGKLFVSKNYTKLRILADGPIRFTFEVTYAPWNANGTMVTETKRISLDAGTHLNRIVSTYSFSGPSALNLVAGVAMHEGATADFPVPDDIAAVWDTPQDPSAGRIATGLMAAPGQQARTTQAAGHAMLEFARRSGEPFIYYAGAGWSKADMPTASAWDDYLKLRLIMLKNPLAFHWLERQAKR